LDGIPIEKSVGRSGLWFRLRLDEYDVATQAMTSHHLRVRDGVLDRFSIPFRYTWPAELDLMAQLAGMSLRERWGDWSREPFTSDSRKHVSVWQKLATSPPSGADNGHH
jgi:hypothetical protein